MQSDSYFYHFLHVSSFGEQMWGENYTECWDAVCHAAELVCMYSIVYRISMSVLSHCGQLMFPSLSLYMHSVCLKKPLNLKYKNTKHVKFYYEGFFLRDTLGKPYAMIC